MLSLEAWCYFPHPLRITQFRLNQKKSGLFWHLMLYQKNRLLNRKIRYDKHAKTKKMTRLFYQKLLVQTPPTIVGPQTQTEIIDQHTQR